MIAQQRTDNWAARHFISLRRLFPPADVCVLSSTLTTWCLLAVIGLGLGLRFGYFLQLQAHPLPAHVASYPGFDQYRYLKFAHEFLSGRHLGAALEGYSVCYSYLIAILYTVFPPHLSTVFLFQFAVGVVAIYVFYKSGRLLFANDAVGLLAALFAASYAPFIFYEGTILRDSIIAYCNLFAFYWFLKWLAHGGYRQLLAGGLFLGLSMVFRPNILPLFVLPYLLIASRWPAKRKLLGAFMALIGMAMIVAPLIIENRILAGRTVMDLEGPQAFWIGNTHDALGVGFHGYGTWQQLAEEGGGHVAKTFAILAREVCRYPWEYVCLYATKFHMFFNGYDVPANLSFDLLRNEIPLLKLGLTFTFICPLALFGMLLVRRQYRGGGLLFGFLWVLSVSVILFHILGQYRIPATPFFILFAAYACYWLIRMVVARQWMALCVALVPITIFTWSSLPDRQLIALYFGGPIRDLDYGNLALSYLDAAEQPSASADQQRRYLTKAAENYQKGLQLLPESDVLLAGLGEVRLRQGAFSEAVRYLSEAIRRYPENARARYYLSLALKELKRTKQTEH